MKLGIRVFGLLCGTMADRSVL